MNRIPTLDGWRGIAILLVLFDHFQVSLLGGCIRPWTRTGQHGVALFFVLSGFLITTKLLERRTTLKLFYIRRFLRLMPAAWTYLALLLILNLITSARITSIAGVIASVFFYRNFVGVAGSAYTCHFWSLSLEEQFYLLWPFVLLFAGIRRARWIAASAAIACAGYRWHFWAYYDRNLFNYQSQVRADAILIGCLLALLCADPAMLRVITRWSKLIAVPALACLIFCIARFQFLPPLFESISFAVLIAFTCFHSSSPLARPFRLAPLAWLGTVSYSLYIWQALFMPFGSPVALFVALPVAALGSYYCIERPFIRFGYMLTSRPPKNAPLANPLPAFAEQS